VAELDGIWWSASGDGPVVVVPRLNIDWTAVDLSALSDRFRVVIVSPRGFGPSARPGSYDGTGFVRDIEHVVDHLEIGTYATFGYSMNGVMAARLAVGAPRVSAVACGGFPLKRLVIYVVVDSAADDRAGGKSIQRGIGASP